MTSQKRSLLGRLHRAYNAFFEPLHQQTLPLSSLTPVSPNQSVNITGRAGADGFWPDHLIISNGGTAGGAADWVVNDLKINNRSQFLWSGDVPGDAFASNAVRSFTRFDVAKAGTPIELIATYVGKNTEGCPLFAALTGVDYDPGLFDIAREAIADALSSAARGFSKHPAVRRAI